MAPSRAGCVNGPFPARTLAFVLLFHGLHLALFAWGWWKQLTDSRLAGLNTLTFSVWISRGAGIALSVDGTLIILPMCKNIMRWLRPKARWLPLDETQWFHRQVAYSLLFYTIVHVSAHYVNFFNVERNQIRPEAAVQIHYNQAGGITGHVMLFCMFLMFTTAHVRIRQQSYETFYYTHHLFIIFLLAFYTHATGCFVRDSTAPFSPFAGKIFWKHCIGYQSWRWELIGGAVYLVERLYRAYSSRQSCKIVRVVRHPYDAIEIQFVKPGMQYKPGQWLYLNIPEVSRTQWHPFTITSCPFDPYISVHVRQVGDWTRAVGDALGAGPTQAREAEELDEMGMYEIALQSGQEMPLIRVDGPYGAPAEDVCDNEIAILIGTGIGVTPWASILKNIFNVRAAAAGPHRKPMRLKRVEFIWVCRDTKSFEWFHMLLASLEEQSREEAEAHDYIRAAQEGESASDTAVKQAQHKPEFLRIHTYLTQRLDANATANIMLNSDLQGPDPLTHLTARTSFGRPDFARLFDDMADTVANGALDPVVDSNIADSQKTDLQQATAKPRPDIRSRFETQRDAVVGVYFCGPGPAAQQISRACRQATENAHTAHMARGRRGRVVRFRFWKENF